MRYSMLVYTTNMCKTLLEAAQYLRTASDGAVRQELLENGREMLEQVRSVLEQHGEDLRTPLPAELRERIERQWMEQESGLEQNLQQLIRCLPENVSYQVRAVFFAELGEKWDAMESVYEFMRDDPRFDPVVVRTPVGRVVNQNGEKKQEIIYKDFLTPMGIPSLGFDQYSLEEDCPELAFISQPYESCTLEQFWPENIAKFTRLVYLPYFLPDLIADDYPTTLAQLPVHRFAWKVVCPTAKQYKFFCRYAANSGLNALVTGIPKMDFCVKIQHHPYPLPTAWAQISGKKTFLWNSWYDIKQSSWRFRKAILDWFAEHDDCALIWRRHPLTDTIVKLYYPEEYEDYLENVKAMERAQNIVIDQETSYAAAFSASCGMLSDFSSLLPQYLLLDKPALLIKSSAFQLTGNSFIDGSWTEKAESEDDIRGFLNRIYRGEDQNASLRRSVRENDLPQADGCCGKRVCEEVWNALRQEEFS